MIMIGDVKSRFLNLRLGEDQLQSYQNDVRIGVRRSFSEALLPKNNVQKHSNPSLLPILNDKQTGQFLLNLVQKFKTTLSTKNTTTKILQLSHFDTKELTSNSRRLSRQRSKQHIKKQPSKHKVNLQKLYNKINTNYNKEQKLWDYHLKVELSLQQAIEELQKIELNRNLQPSRKLTIRQAYQLKKEIVCEIEQEQPAELIRGNIERLAEIALDQKQRDKFLIIALFICLRQKLKFPFTSSEQKSHPQHSTRSQFTFSPTIINYLKHQLSQWHSTKTSQPNIITTKIFSILCLHIMKLQSPMFSSQDIFLITKTIHMKVNVYSIVVDCLTEDKKCEYFQALIYMIYQFYRIVYFVKLDEDLKIQQYNLLMAYLNLYKERHFSRYQLFEQNYCIHKVLSTLKPSSIGIYPYQDTRGRHELNNINLKQSIYNSQKSQNNSFTKTKRLQNNMRSSIFARVGEVYNDVMRGQQRSNSSTSSKKCSNSSGDLSSLPNDKQLIKSIQQIDQSLDNNKLQVKNDSLSSTPKFINTRKSILKNNFKGEVGKLTIGKQTEKVLKLSLSNRFQSTIFKNGQQNIEPKKQLLQSKPFNVDKFCFGFLLLKQQQIYHGQFTITYSQLQQKAVGLSIRVTDPKGFYLAIYNFTNIRTFNWQLTKQNFDKIIWKIFRKIFVTEYMQQQNPFLMKQQMVDLDHIRWYFPNDCQELQGCQVIGILHAYVVYWLRIREFSFAFNGKILLKPQFQLAEVNKYMENLQYEHDRKLFQKRQGFIVPLSKRTNSLSPSKTSQQQRLIFNPIANGFIATYSTSQPQPQAQTQNQSNIFLIIKLTQPKTTTASQFNFVHLVFHQYLREMSILQMGVYKHLLTPSLINDKTKMIRRIAICEYHSKQKLIQSISQILYFYLNENLTRHNKSKENKLLWQKMNFNSPSKYRIEQQFQVDQLITQFKFIPQLRIQFIKEVCLVDEIKPQAFVTGKQEKYTGKMRKRKYKSILTKRPCSFKAFNQVFLAFEEQFSWGKKISSLTKCLQFFCLHNNNDNQGNPSSSYRLECISLYKIGLVQDKTLYQIVTSNGNCYKFYKVKKPFLSKAQIHSQTLYDDENKFNSGSSSNLFTEDNKEQSQLNNKNPLHFLEARIFFTVRYQKILKFKSGNNTRYFSFQIYSSVQQQVPTNNNGDQRLLNQEPQLSQYQQPQFIYQLTDFHQPHIKYYLLTDKKIPSANSQQIKHLINLQHHTLMGQTMQQFTLPINRITFTNEYNQLRTKSVRKKVVSEANQYFEEKILQVDSNVGMETIFLDILHRCNTNQSVHHKKNNFQIDMFQQQQQPRKHSVQQQNFTFQQ